MKQLEKRITSLTVENTRLQGQIDMLRQGQVINKNTISTVTKYPFLRIPYEESLEKYGTDKPDLRNPLIIKDYTNSFKNSNFKIFSQQIDKGFVVKGIVVNNTAKKSRSFFRKFT